MALTQKFRIAADMSARRMTDATGNPISLPTLFQGDKYAFHLKLLDKEDGFNLVEIDRDIVSLSASVGLVQAPPIAGAFALKFLGSSSHTDLLSFRTPADELQAAIKALPEEATYGLEAVNAVGQSTWMLRFTNTASIPLVMHDNQLEPETFVRINEYIQNDRRWVEIKLIQAPIASSAVSARVVADPPVVTLIRTGDTIVDGITTILVTQIESIFVPPEFIGTFEIVFDGRHTSILSESSSPDTIQAALNGMYTDGGLRFKVTNPAKYTAYVEFVGPFAGVAQSLMEIIVKSAPPGDLDFELDFNTGEVAAVLRTTPQIAMAFEVEVWIAQPGAGDDDPGDRFVLFSEVVTIARNMQWDGLAAAASIDWLTPPQPKDYIPFDPSQVNTGIKSYSQTFGNGTLSVFNIAHNLNADALIIGVRENVSGGALLRDTAYTVAITNANQLSITMVAGPPTVNQYVISIIAVGAASQFSSHVHPIGQITGLQDELDSIHTQLDALQAIIPSSIPQDNSAGNVGASPFAKQGLAITFKIPKAFDIFPRSRQSVRSNIAELASTIVSADTDVDPKVLPKIGAFLPAVHDATIVNLANPLPADPLPYKGNVFLVAVPSVVLPGGLGIVSDTVVAGDHVASDGRFWYRVTNPSGKTSYYPTQFEKRLFTVNVSSSMFGLGSVFNVDFLVALRTLGTNVPCQYVLVLEWGNPAQDTSPATTDINLSNVVWNPAPALKQRIIVTDQLTQHAFGLALYRDPAGVLHGNQKFYADAAAALTLPASPTFSLRARLAEFDTDNSFDDPKGLIFYQMDKADATVKYSQSFQQAESAP